jgi:glycosyltransferase involved in cell wall biosynthesis
MSPQISIITVCLNNSSFIDDAINSVLNQTCHNIQYIVIDGGSTDGSFDIINKYRDKIHCIVSEPDKGIYDAMNKGLALATGDVIGFLNADDFYANPNVIQNISNVFESYKCEVVYADLDYVSRTDKHKIIRKWRSGAFHKKRFLKGWMPPHPTFFAKKELYQRFGGFNETLGSSADYELMLRFLYKNNVNVAYLPIVTTKMRVGGQSNRSLKNRFFANLQDRKAWRLNQLNPKWYTLILKPLSKLGQYLN